MATFTITTSDLINKPPYQTGILYLYLDFMETYIFTVDDFTINTIPVYADPENDPLLKIKILDIYAGNTGTLHINNDLVIIGDEILVTDISNGLLEFRSSTSTGSQKNNRFTFDVADIGSGMYGNIIGEVVIENESEVNEPPTIGDGEANIDHGNILIFTRDMFTTQTTPPYYDPEGDAALLLKITSLPTNGIIKLGSLFFPNNIPIQINQIINFNDIDNALLTFTPDDLIITTDIENFTFEIADAGSRIFVS